MNRVRVSLGSCGIAAGGKAVLAACEQAVSERGLDVDIGVTGCLGMCYREVIVVVESPALGRRAYGDVLPDAVAELLHTCFATPDLAPVGLLEDAAFLAPQDRRVLARCGAVDPASLREFEADGGLAGLRRALLKLTPEAIVDEVEHAGLRGRGGAGFATARKWRLARGARPEGRVVVCNADEGDPGAFMDRSLLEGDPYAVLEGLIIAGRAIEAEKGVVYVRDEYPLAVDRLQHALEALRAAGCLGADVLGTGWAFDITVRRGAGAFVCGEETALIAALEGRRGHPRSRPPFPVEAGLCGAPTVVNNVETLANVAWILARGANAFARVGTAESAGTKVFSLAGDVARGGLVEVAMGITIREVLHDIGGGPSGRRPLKAVQIGGPSGGCVPAALFDVPIDYESLTESGAMMGSGGLVAIDEGRCIVDMARFFLEFAERESCGKCSLCRLGTVRIREILQRLCDGEGKRKDLQRLHELGEALQQSSLCGLGRSAPNPVLSSLRHFPDEYEAHLRGECPAGRCRALIRFAIDPTVCEGCTLCLDQCPAEAIAPMGRLIPLKIEADLCVRCGGCRDVCRYRAVGAWPRAT